MGLGEIINEAEKPIEWNIGQEWKSSIERRKSRYVMGIYGLEGTAKTGVALSCRSPEEIETGSRVAIIDADDSAIPIWEECHNFDPDIRILNPLVSKKLPNGKRDVDYVDTYEHILAQIGWIEDNHESKNIDYIIFDGIDTFLKWCEHKMKVEWYDSEFVNNDQIGLDWGKRNQMYYRVVRWLKSIPANIIFTAHMNKDTSFEEVNEGGHKKKKMVTRLSGANWHRGKQQDMADELYQIIHMRRTFNQLGTYKESLYTGTVEKWKGNARMEGRVFDVLKTKLNPENNKCEEMHWYGLFDQLREVDKSDKAPTTKKKDSPKKPTKVSSEILSNALSEEDEEENEESDGDDFSDFL